MSAQAFFKSGDPAKRANAIVQATTHFNDAKLLADLSKNLGQAMVGINCDDLSKQELMHTRGE